MKERFCAYSIMRPMVYHIEMYSSEKLFDEYEVTFVNGTGKWITWLVRGGFDCDRTISRSK